MADTLTTITDFILKPSAPFAAGLVLFGTVWGFFKGVESVLTEDTKLEIAVWLLGVKVGQKMEPWPDTFAKVFDRVFGTKHLSWKCFLRSCVASVSSTGLTVLLLFFQSASTFVATISFMRKHIGIFILSVVVGNLIPDYVSLLKSRYMMRRIEGVQDDGDKIFMLLGIDMFITVLVAFTTRELIERIDLGFLRLDARTGSTDAVEAFEVYVVYAGRWLWFFPAFFTSIWLWLYAGSGFLLKAARRFDVGFDWFNHKFEIEKKPLSSIGLVAGALVALICWAAAIIRHFVS